MVELKLYALEPPRLEINGEGVDLHLRKETALLVYLTITKEEHSWGGLATMFWLDKGQSKARPNLRQTLYQINKMVGWRRLLQKQSPSLWVPRLKLGEMWTPFRGICGSQPLIMERWGHLTLNPPGC